MTKPQRILLIRLDRIGDLLLTTPAVRALRLAFPRSYLAMVVRSAVVDAVAQNPDLDEVISYDKEGSESGIWSTLQFARRLARKAFDTAVIFHPTHRAHSLAFLAGIPRRIGFDRKWGFLLTDRLAHLKQQGLKHEVDYSLDLLAPLGVANGVERRPVFSLQEEDLRAVETFLTRERVDRSRLVVVHPGASCISKRWPRDRFAQLADQLITTLGAQVVFVSGAGDVPLCQEVLQQMHGQALSLAGKTTVGELAALLSMSRLLISNDSGPVHVAAAVGTPCVAIFGRSDPGLSPRRWGPLGPRDVVLHKDVGCAVCLAHKCQIHFKCLTEISVDEVLEQARRLLRVQS